MARLITQVDTDGIVAFTPAIDNYASYNPLAFLVKLWGANHTNYVMDYHLKTNSPAIGVGADLSTSFTADLDGQTRTVPWDIGAYKYQSDTDLVLPAAPSGLGVI